MTYQALQLQLIVNFLLQETHYLLDLVVATDGVQSFTLKEPKTMFVLYIITGLTLSITPQHTLILTA